MERNKRWVLDAVKLLNAEQCSKKSHANSTSSKNIMRLQQYCKQSQGLERTVGAICFCLVKILRFGFGQISNLITIGLNP